MTTINSGQRLPRETQSANNIYTPKKAVPLTSLMKANVIIIITQCPTLSKMGASSTITTDTVYKEIIVHFSKASVIPAPFSTAWVSLPYQHHLALYGYDHHTSTIQHCMGSTAIPAPFSTIWVPLPYQHHSALHEFHYLTCTIQHCMGLSYQHHSALLRSIIPAPFSTITV